MTKLTHNVPGIRPDRAEVYCDNCGHKFDAKGNPCRAVPRSRVPAKCPECPVNGFVCFNEYSHVSGTVGEIRVERIEG